VSIETEREAMIAALEAGLCGQRQPVVIQELKRENLGGSSSFATERLLVRLGDGRNLEIFFKDLNPARQLPEAKEIREPGLGPSRREYWMYTEVLDRGRHGTPELYASRWTESDGRLWLFLEFAGPKRLSRLGDFALWVDAARWAGAFHAATRDIDSCARRLLGRFDTPRYTESARRLEESLGRFVEEDRATLRVALDLLDAACERASSLPRCLLHGEYFGKNVMIRPDSEQHIAVVDWETAAVGPGAVDLVSIAAGRWTRDQRQEMYRAYYDAYRSTVTDCPPWSAFKVETEDVALCQAILWLAYWSRGDDAHVNRWMRELRTVLAARDREARPGRA
jgi:hypothetical protein